MTYVRCDVLIIRISDLLGDDVTSGDVRPDTRQDGLLTLNDDVLTNIGIHLQRRRGEQSAKHK